MPTFREFQLNLMFYFTLNATITRFQLFCVYLSACEENKILSNIIKGKTKHTPGWTGDFIYGIWTEGNRYVDECGKGKYWYGYNNEDQKNYSMNAVLVGSGKIVLHYKNCNRYGYALVHLNNRLIDSTRRNTESTATFDFSNGDVLKIGHNYWGIVQLFSLKFLCTN